MCVLIFYTTLVRNIFHSKKKWARYDQKCMLVYMQSARYYCQILMIFEFSRQFFRKIHKYQISWKSVHWEPSCSIQTDGRTDMKKLIVAFHSYANAPKNNDPPMPSTHHSRNKPFCAATRPRTQRHKNHGCVTSKSQTFVVLMSRLALGPTQPPFL
jgi:hypothetical protein